MASSCPNCSTKIGCGCQRRIASNGASVCRDCISTYEYSLSLKKNSESPVLPLNPASTMPSGVQVFYRGKEKLG